MIHVWQIVQGAADLARQQAAAASLQARPDVFGDWPSLSPEASGEILVGASGMRSALHHESNLACGASAAATPSAHPATGNDNASVLGRFSSSICCTALPAGCHACLGCSCS